MIAVQIYFLMAVKAHGGVPLLTRTDKGSETLLMVETQVGLRQIAANELLRVEECHYFGPCTRNTKIESFWGRLAVRKTGRFRELFEAYERAGEWNGSSEAPIHSLSDTCIWIPSETGVANFAGTHNTNPIRSQKHRDHYLPTGKPWSLYRNPPVDARDLKIDVDMALIDEMLEDLSQWNHDEYLHPTTLAECIRILQEAGLPLRHDGILAGHTLHRDMYIKLRTELQTRAHSPPDVEIPRGGRKWLWEKGKIHQEGYDEFQKQLEAMIEDPHRPEPLFEHMVRRQAPDMLYDEVEDLFCREGREGEIDREEQSGI
ncbi:hypothetical protein Dda_6942 [Drechslerella dactyloides]|uniref:Uncharacterized protein n=1 Tax=Drechslerella dactyloides TaxID=74499 RepID=A0AAD6IUS7_DREDA|nr:hypothetical protein Dda_6942 [Drechslerella dactyloides]